MKGLALSAVLLLGAFATIRCRGAIAPRHVGCPSRGPITIEVLRRDKVEAAELIARHDVNAALQKHYQIITFASAPEMRTSRDAQVFKAESIESLYGIHEQQSVAALRRTLTP